MDSLKLTRLAWKPEFVGWARHVAVGHVGQDGLWLWLWLWLLLLLLLLLLFLFLWLRWVLLWLSLFLKLFSFNYLASFFLESKPKVFPKDELQPSKKIHE